MINMTEKERIEVDMKELTYKDINAYLFPDPITILCNWGHDITTDLCFICGKKFTYILKSKKIPEVACGDENHHMCSKCYEKLFIEEMKSSGNDEDE